MQESSNDNPPEPITVSVIMATYNRAGYIGRALDSILEQKRPPDEVLVVNDGSTDDTASVLAGYGDRIRVISQANQGKPAALNNAIPRATGSHIWLFDDDDFALPHALETHVAFLDGHPELDFCFSRNYTFDGAGEIADPKAWREPYSPNYHSETLLIHLMRDCSLVFQALLVPKRCLLALGLFDPTLGRAEDYDMLLRLSRHYASACTDERTFVWRNHAGERGSATERHSDADRTRLFRKYEREIFARVRRDVSLAEYLAPKQRQPWNQTREVDALLQRADIMWRHDMIAEGAADLADACSLATQTGRVDEIEAAFTHAADVGDPVFVDNVRERVRALAGVIPAHRRQHLAPHVFKGLYWSVSRALRQQRHRDAARLACAAPVFGWYLLRRPATVHTSFDS